MDKLFEELGTARMYQRYRINYDDTRVAQEITSFLRQKLPKEPGSIAVDVACGTGFLTRVLGPHFTSVIGVDCSEAQLRVARENTIDTNIEYRNGYGEDLRLIKDSSVDLVSVAIAVYYLDMTQFLSEVDRILKPGGAIAFITDDHRPGKRAIFLKPETSNANVILGCQTVIDEVVATMITMVDERYHQLVEAGGKPLAPDSYEQHHVVVPASRLGNIESFVGFISSIGGIMAYMRKNPEKDDIREVYKGRLLSLLSAISPNPEDVQLTICTDLQCHIYRKPMTPPTHSDNT